MFLHKIIVVDTRLRSPVHGLRQGGIFYVLFLIIALWPKVNVGAEQAIDSERSSGDSCQPLTAACRNMPQDDGINGAAEKILSMLDTPQRAVSSSLRSLAIRVDEFLSNEKVYYDATGSFIRVSGDAVWEEAGNVGYTADIRIKLNLPRTKRKLKFFFESDPDERRNDIDKGLQGTPLDAAAESSYYAGIQAQSGKQDRWRYRSGLGIRIRFPVDYFVRLRADRIYRLDGWSLRLDETLYWFEQTGTGFETSMEFDHKLADKVLFRSRSLASWTTETDNFNLSQVGSIVQTLDKRRMIAYQAGVYDLSDSAIIATDYLVALRYRQNVHGNYLFMETAPQIRYRKIYDYQAEYSVIFRLEWLFDG